MTPKGFEPLFWERAIGTYQSRNQATPKGFEPLFWERAIGTYRSPNQVTPKGFEPLFWERAVGTYQSPNQVTPRGFEPLFLPAEGFLILAALATGLALFACGCLERPSRPPLPAAGVRAVTHTLKGPGA